MQNFNNSASPQTVHTASLPGFYSVSVETSGFAHVQTDAGETVLDTNAGPRASGICWLESGDSVVLLTGAAGSYVVGVRLDRFASDTL